MTRRTRPSDLSTTAKQIQELEYLMMRICETLKIKHRYV